MPSDSQDIRRAILARWHETLSRYGNLFASDSISGTSPPSVFVGSHRYPRVSVGPMVPPMHGDTGLLDRPEEWIGKSLEEIVNFRLGLVRGVKHVRADQVDGRYVEQLQELSMSSRPADSDIAFEGTTRSGISLDGETAPFGPTGRIRSAKFSPSSASRPIERAFYDRDLGARDAVLGLASACWAGGEGLSRRGGALPPLTT